MRGLVGERHPDPDDGRAVLVRLTPTGEQRARAAVAAVLDADRRFLSPLTGKARTDLIGGLRRLLLHAESARPDATPPPG